MVSSAVRVGAGEVDMVDGAGEVGTAVGAGGMVSSAVSAGEVDMVDGAGEVGTAVGAGGMVSTAVGAGDRDRAEFHRGHSVAVHRKVDTLANARSASVGDMVGTALPTTAVATVDCRRQSCRSNRVSSHGSNLNSSTG